MEQKFLYVVNHFIPYPQSECGGIWVVVAKTDDECFDLIVDYDGEVNQNYYVTLRECVMGARTYALSDDVESGVVESFTT
jgi:hypothetical protein